MEEILQLQGKIQSLDPLGADAIFAQLPTYNTMRNVQGLLDGTRSVLPTLEEEAASPSQERGSPYFSGRILKVCRNMHKD